MARDLPASLRTHLRENPGKVRCKVIEVEIKGVEISINIVALGATRQKGEAKVVGCGSVRRNDRPAHGSMTQWNR